MDKEDELVSGLQSDPKFLPYWYRYDKEGMQYFYDWCNNSKYYYFTKTEIKIIKQHIMDMINTTQKPLTLIELGSGNSPKSRMFIDAILETQTKLEYWPVEIAEDVLNQAATELHSEYGDRLVVKPVAGDYSEGIDAIKSIHGNKLIIWIGGGVLNQTYDYQVRTFEAISNTMKGKDRLIISFDTTQIADVVEKAYLDPEGVITPHSLNPIWRLNREFGSKINTDMFELEAKFILDTDVNSMSTILIRVRSKYDQEYDIPGLGISVTFKQGEYLNLYDGDGASAKYTLEQIKMMGKKGRQLLLNYWTDADTHVSICCFRKNE